ECYKQKEVLFPWMTWQQFLDLGKDVLAFHHVCDKAMEVAAGKRKRETMGQDVSKVIKRRCSGVTPKCLGMKPVELLDKNGIEVAPGYHVAVEGAPQKIYFYADIAVKSGIPVMDSRENVNDVQIAPNVKRAFDIDDFGGGNMRMPSGLKTWNQLEIRSRTTRQKRDELTSKRPAEKGKPTKKGDGDDASFHDDGSDYEVPWSCCFFGRGSAEHPWLPAIEKDGILKKMAGGYYAKTPKYWIKVLGLAQGAGGNTVPKEVGQAKLCRTREGKTTDADRLEKHIDLFNDSLKPPSSQVHLMSDDALRALIEKLEPGLTLKKFQALSDLALRLSSKSDPALTELVCVPDPIGNNKKHTFDALNLPHHAIAKQVGKTAYYDFAKEEYFGKVILKLLCMNSAEGDLRLRGVDVEAKKVFSLPEDLPLEDWVVDFSIQMSLLHECVDFIVGPRIVGADVEDPRGLLQQIQPPAANAQADDFFSIIAPSLADGHRAQTLFAECAKPSAKHDEHYQEVKAMLNKMELAAKSGERETRPVLTNVCAKLLGWDQCMPRGSCSRVRDLLWAQVMSTYQAQAGHSEESNPEEPREEVFVDKVELRDYIEKLNRAIGSFDQEKRVAYINDMCIEYQTTKDIKTLARLENVLGQLQEGEVLPPAALVSISNAAKHASQHMIEVAERDSEQASTEQIMIKRGKYAEGIVVAAKNFVNMMEVTKCVMAMGPDADARSKSEQRTPRLLELGRALTSFESAIQTSKGGGGGPKFGRSEYERPVQTKQEVATALIKNLKEKNLNAMQDAEKIYGMKSSTVPTWHDGLSADVKWAELLETKQARDFHANVLRQHDDLFASVKMLVVKWDEMMQLRADLSALYTERLILDKAGNSSIQKAELRRHAMAAKAFCRDMGGEQAAKAVFAPVAMKMKLALQGK
ncbi:unnamed protein product, partial [Prorocentrum cordatum]